MTPDPANAKARMDKVKQRTTPWARGANWAVGAASAILLLLSVGGYLYHREQLAEIAAEHLRVMVVGPPRLQAGILNRYTITTSTVTGAAMPAQIELAVYNPAGKQLTRHKEKTDQRGQLAIDIPADLPVPTGSRLEVLAVHQSQLQRFDARLAVEPMQYATVLTLDRLLYRPGERIFYRSLTLSRFGLAADREFTVHIEILDPAGATIAASEMQAGTQKGIASGQFTLPAETADGRYTLVARSPDGAFPEARCTFIVLSSPQPQLAKQLEFLRDDYGAGQTVVADFLAESTKGGPAATARLDVVATLDGQVIHRQTQETSDSGTCRVEFVLPKEIARGDAQLSVTVQRSGIEETILKRIPINLNRVDVQFHPEGGQLAADLENRVYLAARNPLGEPVPISARVVDGDDNPVAEVETAYDGMGSFTFTPRPGRSYRLKIESPTGVVDEPKLPPASTDAGIVIDAGLGVFEQDRPLEFAIRASKEGVPLLAAAWCRGVLVGQTPLATRLGPNGNQANPVVVPLAEGVGGVVRLLVYDYSSSPPRAVAQRLVYRRPARRLRVKVEPAQREFSPRQPVELSLLASDEAGEPVPAVLGVTVADESFWKLAGGHTPALPTQLLLINELENADDLENADFYLSDQPRAPIGLDLLLGNQPSRQTGPPPTLLDNLGDLRTRYEGSLATYRAQRTRTLNTLTTAGFLGGAGLVLLVAMLALLNIPTGLRLWIPALATAAVCLVIGAILMNPGRLKSGPDAAVAFTPFGGAPSTTAQEQKSHQPAASNTSRRPEATAGAEAHQALAERPPIQESAATTPYWNPLLVTGADGRALVRFDLPNSVATFRVSVDAHCGASPPSSRLGAGSGHVISRLPFSLKSALPPQVTAGDRINLPLAVANLTARPLSVGLVLEHGELVGLQGYARRTLELRAQQHAREYFTLDVAGRKGVCPIRFHAAAGPLDDSLSSRLVVVPPGFPHSLSFSGQLNGPQEVTVDLPDAWAPSSLEVRLEAFPSLLASLQESAEAMLRKPHGCFEQTASVLYANALLLQAAQDRGAAHPAAIRRAKNVLDEADAELLAYEARGGGYAQFPGEPSDQAITAYGLMVLRKMSLVNHVDATTLDRVSQWLLARRDGQGGFRREPTPPDDGLEPVPPELNDAYITWALAESGQAGIDREVEHVVQAARQSNNPYLIALATLAALDAGKPSDAKPLAEKLVHFQAADGRLEGKEGSSVSSRGKTQTVETTSLAAMAWLRLPEFAAQAQAAIDCIHHNRDASGQFGSAQATVLALKALTEHARANPQPTADGTLLVKRNDLLIGQREFKAGRQDAIMMDGLESMLQPGKNHLVIALAGGSRMPYVLGVRYCSSKPPAQSDCPVRLSTQLTASQVKAGQHVAMVAQLANMTDAALPMTVAVIGLPAGSEASIEQLDAFRRTGAIHQYELCPREVVCYWRELAPKKQVDLAIDLLAAIPGRYTAPASCIYLDDAPQRKQWTDPVIVEIARP